MTFSKPTSAGYLANHMARLFAQGLHRRIRPLGLAPAQFMVLLELWHQDHLTQSALASRLDVEQATMANTLARMQRDGLITRTPSADDKRARIISLTAKARDLQTPAQAAAQAQNDAALAGLPQADRAQLINLMTTVIETLKTGANRG